MENLLEELNKDNKGSTDDSKFLSQIQKKPDPIFSLYDFLFPGGKLAKLVNPLLNNFELKSLSLSVESMKSIKKRKST